ncbi:hypothetical protein [Nocardia sp. NPDC057440]|uniref:hypothetical protein n=1 Tax=Nocardia sp. NPDC057440 TaxID=3346134 RepID=UPI00366B7ABA
MTPWWIDLLGVAWKLAAAGFISAVVIGLWTGPGDEYSGAPAEAEDDGEQHPYDPDLQRDWDIADRMGAL